MFYLQRELHVEVSCPQKPEKKAVGEGPDSGQLSGLQRSPPQAVHVRAELLRVVREFIKLRPVHVALRSGYISLLPADCCLGEEAGNRRSANGRTRRGRGSVCVCVCV